MAPIVLYSTRRTPAGRAVELTAKMIGIDLDVQYIDLAKKENMTEEYLKVSDRLLFSRLLHHFHPLIFRPSADESDAHRADGQR